VAGVSLREYTTDARVLAECVIRYYETFRPDAVWLSADTWVTAQAMGAAVGFVGDDQPMSGTGEPLVRSAADIDKLPAPDPASQGRWPLMLDALGRVVRAIGNEVFVVACFDQYPFSLACALMGLDQTMLKLADDPGLVRSLMERCAEFSVAYAHALAAVGADMLSGGDSPAGLIGPRLYREIALPYERQVIARIKASTDRPVSLHICGDASPVLGDMAGSGADVLELDYQVDLAEAARIVGPDVAIWGNLDPVRVLARGTPEQVRQATRDVLRTMRAEQQRRFVVSSGCTLAVETPAENLRAMLETVNE
jgi:MtaA/CmuA family methyltransferase